MHRAAPGTDWQAMDDQVRMEKAKRRFEQVKQQRLLRGGQALDTVANGQVVGHWREIGSKNQAGRSIFADYDPVTDEVFVATAGGVVWQGNLFGSNWTAKNDLMKIHNINMLKVIYKGGKRRLLVSQGNTRNGRFLYSEDDGQTWTVATGFATAHDWGGVRRTIVTPVAGQPHIYCLVEEWNPVDWEGSMALYASSDGGNSFQMMRFFQKSFYTENNKKKIDLWASGSDVFLLIKGIIYKVNGVSLVTIAPLPISSPSYDNLALTGAQIGGNTYLYAAYRYNQANSTSILRSSDAGVSWQIGGNVNSWLFRQNSFSCSQKDPKKVYIGQLDVYGSTDSAKTFTRISDWTDYYTAPAKNLHADIPSITPFQRANGGESWFINTDGGLFISHDDLKSFTNISLDGLNAGQYYDTYTSPKWPQDLHIGSQDQGYQRSVQDRYEGTRDLDQVISGDYGHYVSGDSGASLWINYPGFTGYYGNAHHSDTRTARVDFDWIGNNNLWLAPMVADPVIPTRAYLLGGNISNDPGKKSGSFIIQMDAQGNFITRNQLAYDFSNGGSSTLSAMGISPVDPNHWYVCTDNGEFYHSADAGGNWDETQNFLSPGSHYFYGNSILPSPNTASRVYVAGSGYNGDPVYVSDTYGSSFKPISNGLPNSLVYDLACNPDESMLFAATEVGPYVYVVADSQWHELGALSAPDQTYWSVEYIPTLNIARFGTYGRGVWDYVICDKFSPDLTADFDIFGSGPSYSLTNNSTGGHFYAWNFGDGNTSSLKSTFHSFTRTGVYPVQLISANYCGADTIVKQIDYLAASIDYPLSQGNFTIAPNPSKGDLILKRTGEDRHNSLTIKLLDTQGRTVSYRQIRQFGDQQSFQFNELPAGLYFLEVIDRKKSTKEILRWMKL